jgi:hypothetical protein
MIVAMDKLKGKVVSVVVEVPCHKGVWLHTFLTSTLDGGE